MWVVNGVYCTVQQSLENVDVRYHLDLTNISAVFLKVLVIKTLDPDWIRIRIRIRIHLKCWIRFWIK